MNWEPSESQGRPLKLWLERGREGCGGLVGSVASERRGYKNLQQGSELKVQPRDPEEVKPWLGQGLRVKMKEKSSVKMGTDADPSVAF